MLDLTILTITSDPKFLALFRGCIHDQVATGSRMIVARTIDEACSLLKTVQPRLVVVHWALDGKHYEQLDRLLWTTTVQTRRVPVLVIAERYRTDQATMMFRMGVSEYISRTHHFDQLGGVFAAYLPAAVSAEPAFLSEAVATTGNAWASSQGTQPIASRAV
jgi:DNA-binding response OmpR family regulator